MIRLGAIADIHAHEGNGHVLHELFTRCQSEMDVLIIAGDLTDTGLESEARIVTDALDGIDLTVVVVLGNHDFHHHEHAAITRVLEECGVVVLDGDGWIHEQNGVRIGFAGCVGFGGGFRPFNLTSFGEQEWKTLYEKTIQETRKLDRALSAVKDADYIIGVTHYSPTEDTMGDEPESLHPFLGSSELGDALERHHVQFSVHGHAHRGRRDGCTANGTLVYNVALALISEPIVWTFKEDGNGSMNPVLLSKAHAETGTRQVDR